MSTVTTPSPADSGGLAPDTAVAPTQGTGGKKLPIIFGVMALVLAVVLITAGHSGRTTFQLAAGTDVVTLPDITVPSMLTAWIMVAVCAAATAESLRRLFMHVSQPMWLPILFAFAWMVGFLS